jgi:hypothetical protein
MLHGEAEGEEREPPSRCPRHSAGIRMRGSMGGPRESCIPRRRRGANRWVVALGLFVTIASVVVAAGTDYYNILGVRRGADADDIKRAYRELARKHHPDKSKEKGAQERFVELQRAHEVLSDPEKRRLYDMYGKDPDDPDVQHQQNMRERRQRFRQYDSPMMEAFFDRPFSSFPPPRHLLSPACRNPLPQAPCELEADLIVSPAWSPNLFLSPILLP